MLSVLDVGNTQKCGIGLLPGNSNSPSTLWLLEAHGNLFGIIHGMSDMMLAVHKLSMVMRSTWEHH